MKNISKNNKKIKVDKNIDAYSENEDGRVTNLDDIGGVSKTENALKYLMMSSKKSRGVGTSDSPRTRRVQRNGHSVHASHGKSKSIMNWIKKEQNQN